MNDLINEASLMAYADGELDEAAADAVERAATDDPHLARRISDFLRSRRLARAAMGTGDLPPVPDELRAAILAEAEPAGEPATAGRSVRTFRGFAAPLAAAAALLVGIVVGDAIAPNSALGDTVALLEGAVASELLATAASGEERMAGTARLRAIATYRLPSGDICREVHLFRDNARLDTIECRDGARWSVRLLVFDPEDGDTYTTASADDPVDAFLTRVGAGEPLLGAAEMEAIREARS